VDLQRIRGFGDLIAQTVYLNAIRKHYIRLFIAFFGTEKPLAGLGVSLQIHEIRGSI
jgi:hypothetical protein